MPWRGPPGPSDPVDDGVVVAAAGTGDGAVGDSVEGATGVAVGWSVTGVGAGQKFFGRPSLRRAMMFFWISEAPPPMVSITVYR